MNNDESYTWEWQDDDKSWITYDNETSSILEENYKNSNSLLSLSHGIFSTRGPYIINFNTMTQKNNMGTTRSIRCLKSSATQPVAQWLFRKGNRLSSWKLFDPGNIKLIENAFSTHCPNIIIQIEGKDYSIEFWNMLQRNHKSGYERSVRRTVPFNNFFPATSYRIPKKKALKRRLVETSSKCSITLTVHKAKNLNVSFPFIEVNTTLCKLSWTTSTYKNVLNPQPVWNEETQFDFNTFTMQGKLSLVVKAMKFPHSDYVGRLDIPLQTIMKEPKIENRWMPLTAEKCSTGAPKEIQCSIIFREHPQEPQKALSLTQLLTEYATIGSLSPRKNWPQHPQSRPGSPPLRSSAANFPPRPSNSNLKFMASIHSKPESTAKPEVKPEAKPELKPESKPEVKPESKPEVKPEAKPEAKLEGELEVKPEGELEAKLEGELEAKLEGELEVKQEGELEGELEVKLEGELEVKPEAKLEGELEVKLEGELEVKLEEDREAVIDLYREEIQRYRMIQEEALEKCKNIREVYSFQEEIGRGAYGVVYKAICNTTVLVVAIKELRKEDLDLTSFQNEIDILRYIQDPYCISLFASHDTTDAIYIVMEMCDGGDLLQHIEYEPLEQVEAAAVIYDVLLGLLYLHRNNIAHLDIKPENIIYHTSTGTWKIADFGLALPFVRPPLDNNNNDNDNDLTTGGYLHSPTGTPMYMSPERLTGHCTESADCWSCGVLTFLVNIGEEPYNDPPFVDIIEGKEKWELLQVLECRELEDFVRQLMNRNWKRRMTVEEAIEHPWFKKQFNWD